MKSEDIAKSEGALIGHFEFFRFRTPCGATEPSDQGVELPFFHCVDTAEVCDHSDTRLSLVVAIRLHDLEVASATIACDPREHGTFDIT